MSQETAATEEKKRSPLGQALYDLLHNLEGQDFESWLTWLNPWHVKLDEHGKPTGSRMMGPPSVGPARGWCDYGVDDDDLPQLSEEDRRTQEEECKKWVPAHTLGDGITAAQMLRWCDDKEVPDIKALSDIIGLLQIVQFRGERAQQIIARFYWALEQPFGKVTPLGKQLYFRKQRVTSLAVHVFLEKYGIISMLHDIPIAQWDKRFGQLVDLLRAK